ncbi:hypothetical protein Q7P37_001778 [Cladosporium fusiforme]
MGRPDSRSLSNDRDEVYDATSELQLPATETDSTFASLPSFDEPPPPYDAFRPLPSVSSIPNTQPSGLAASPSHIIDFPSSPQLSLYHTKNRLNSSIFHLSISKDQPLYAVVFEGAWNYRQNIILFPDAEYEAGRAKAPAKEPLARVKGKGFWTTAADIQLLSSGPERAVHPAGSVATTSLRCRGLKTVVWGFVARTAGEGTEEGFEWRYSRGKEVKDLGKGSSGWKLVRLGREGVGLVQESEDDELESCYGSKIGEKVSNKEAKSNEIECHDDAFGRHSFSAAFFSSFGLFVFPYICQRQR